jgi:hypothetical protein
MHFNSAFPYSLTYKPQDGLVRSTYAGRAASSRAGTQHTKLRDKSVASICRVRQYDGNWRCTIVITSWDINSGIRGSIRYEPGLPP